MAASSRLSYIGMGMVFPSAANFHQKHIRLGTCFSSEHAERVEGVSPSNRGQDARDTKQNAQYSRRAGSLTCCRPFLIAVKLMRVFERIRAKWGKKGEKTQKRHVSGMRYRVFAPGSSHPVSAPVRKAQPGRPRMSRMCRIFFEDSLAKEPAGVHNTGSSHLSNARGGSMIPGGGTHSRREAKLGESWKLQQNTSRT